MDFKYGDLIVKCHQCGGEEVIEELVTDGRAIYLFNREDSFVKLNCTKCDITMEMRIRPNVEANEKAEIEASDATAIKGKELKQDIIKDEELQKEVAQKEIV